MEPSPQHPAQDPVPDPAVDPPTCSLLTGRNLRYVLTETLFGRGPTTVADLVVAVAQGGFTVRGRPSKTISDALRWEIAHGRVVRLGKGRYGPGRMPKQTRSWIRCRVRRLAATSAGATAATGATTASAHTSAHAAMRPTESPTARPATACGRATAGPSGGEQSGPARPAAAPRRRGSEDDEVTVVGAGWSAEDEAADWDVEVALAALDAARAAPYPAEPRPHPAPPRGTRDPDPG
jgi:hypothetical protein